MADIMGTHAWKNNAELIADVARLGYLRPEWRTLDPTYGTGRFWTVWRPLDLVVSDLNPKKSSMGPVDFTALPWADGEFDAVVFDPPYALRGTSTGEGPTASDEDYGIEEYMPWQDRHLMIRNGLSEAIRVTKRSTAREPRYVFLKCMDQVCSGAVRWQTDEFTRHAESLGCVKRDRFDILGYREQPKEKDPDKPKKRQLHARHNVSSLLVFRTPRPNWKPST